ncbi:RagB/SusD family nutrient uptake outer membrane protein [Prevotella stercorea]|uniref:RagB/SusD family nutrient uptake outer membrane protein n=1 Tax=Leyella stercorea TaxID=363265 RepID=UPI001F470539|nr:RagB/SusD family nutrient uptake outer membrane protein [Leyella stercorea]MCF2645717.1 RagB/SusD family nutrient uptake outer membrane protein [Leyella stercorea]
MKNNIIKIGLFGILAMGAASCQDTLDTHPTTTFDEATVWGSKATANAFVNATYDNVITMFTGNGSCASWEARTPNGIKCSQVGEGIDGLATELGLSRSSDFGINRFALLRRCNLIIQKAQASTAMTEGDKAEIIAKGRLLRGLVFFDQARKMGRFVPMCEVITEKDEDKATIPMTKNVAESYKYVIDDLEAAIPGLPTEALPGEPTKYAAEVLLSRALLQAYAYTKNTEYLDKAITYAKDVTENCSLSNTYGGMFNEKDETNPEILWGYYRLKANSTIGGYEELIRTYPNIGADDVTNSKSPVKVQNPNGRTFEGWAIYFPTQDMVDQYLVTDEETGKALPWWETSQYKKNVDVLDPTTVTAAGQIDSYEQVNGNARRIPTPQDFAQLNSAHPTNLRYHKLKAGSETNLSKLMYSGRDARFASSIVYDGCTWIGETVETNLGGNLSMGVRDKEDGGWYNTTTGYYWRKSNIESPEPRAYFDCKVQLHYNMCRTGEAFMNLAEAYLLKKDVAKAVEALNATRVKHGKIAPSTATTEAEAWADYIRERRVEMANENGDIYFSYLRWGKYGGYANNGREAGDVIYDLDRPVYKIEISRDRTQLLINQVTLLGSANRNFTTKRYLFPIAQGFLDTRESYGLDHEQNEGW